MKNKKTIYVLIPIVILIWGFVIYQVFSFSDTGVAFTPSNNFEFKPILLKKIDTFSIQVNSRDPFLGKVIVDTNTKPVKIIKSKSKVVNVPVEVIWPTIQYKGIVSDTKDKIKIYMLIINGQTCLMKKGEKMQDVTLKDGDKETVYTLYKGDVKVVFIQ